MKEKIENFTYHGLVIEKSTYEDGEVEYDVKNETTDNGFIWCSNPTKEEIQDYIGFFDFIEGKI